MTHSNLEQVARVIFLVGRNHFNFSHPFLIGQVLAA